MNPQNKNGKAISIFDGMKISKGTLIKIVDGYFFLLLNDCLVKINQTFISPQTKTKTFVLDFPIYGISLVNNELGKKVFLYTLSETCLYYFPKEI